MTALQQQKAIEAKIKQLENSEIQVGRAKLVLVDKDNTKKSGLYIQSSAYASEKWFCVSKSTPAGVRDSLNSLINDLLRLRNELPD